MPNTAWNDQDLRLDSSGWIALRPRVEKKISKKIPIGVLPNHHQRTFLQSLMGADAEALRQT